VPSTRLVIIWLKRCLARSLIEPALESAPVGLGLGVGEGDATGVGVGVGVGVLEPAGHGCWVCPDPSPETLFVRLFIGVDEGEGEGDGFVPGQSTAVTAAADAD